ncbi:aspartate carbamoyltransferase [Patescibacteria group bacterium]|nr:aspartate carbamoyltransferase [Patescibacteria group bacterium]
MSPKHIISSAEIANREFLNRLFTRAGELEKKAELTLTGKLAATVFYEPSTRTRLSFETAMQRMGGMIVTTENAGQFSSAIKGETIADSTRIISAYADCIIMRHPQIGAAAQAAEVATVPVINAGDGAGEHPTQALLDMYTIEKELGRRGDFHIALIGDLKFSRTVHSLLYLLVLYPGVKVSLVMPEKLALPASCLTFLKKHQVPVEVYTDLTSVLKTADIFYLTRVQKERFDSTEEYEALKDVYILTDAEVSQMKKEARIMHPLPRINEIATSVDENPRAAYFRQAANGLYVRMALLEYVMLSDEV